MKKAIRKTLSAVLAMLLLLSVLPMATFAAEIEVHEHSTACCAEAGVLPAILCNHEITHVAEGYAYVPRDADYHDVYSAVVTTCPGCNSKWYDLKSFLRTEEHDQATKSNGHCKLCLNLL